MTDAKTPKPVALGKFKPLLAGTSLARILRRRGLGAAHGIGHNRDDAGVITLVLPDGVPAEALVAGEAKAAAKGSRNPRGSER